MNDKKSKKERIQKQWAQIVAKAWVDEDFKKKLLANPSQVLQDYGIETLPGVTFKILENTKKTVFFVLPSKPEGDVSEEELRNISAAGMTCFTSTSGIVGAC